MNTGQIITVAVICGVVVFVAMTLFIAHLRFKLRERKFDEADIWLYREFTRCNVMVFGKKGSGKDVLFAHVIALRGEKHYSNIPYDSNTELISLCQISAGNNTFEDCINGTIRKFDPRFEDGCDIYISDAGIYFPNTSDRHLNELYPSMPVLMALSRHLYNNNIHTNCQAFNRPWKKLREQADSFIQVLRTVRHGNCLYVKILGYDKYSNAENETSPAVEYTVRVPVAELQYDDRYFRTVFLNSEPSVRERIIQQITRRR